MTVSNKYHQTSQINRHENFYHRVVVRMLQFCPHCANLLLLDNTSMLKLCCQTCPYVTYVTKPISTTQYTEQKQVDDILGGAEAWKHLDKTQGETDRQIDRYREIREKRERECVCVCGLRQHVLAKSVSFSLRPFVLPSQVFQVQQQYRVLSSDADALRRRADDDLSHVHRMRLPVAGKLIGHTSRFVYLTCAYILRLYQ